MIGRRPGTAAGNPAQDAICPPSCIPKKPTNATKSARWANARAACAFGLPVNLNTRAESRNSPKIEVPSFAEVDLQQGRATWMQVCRNCHLSGVAGAPAVNDSAAWQQRLAKGKETLYRNAIDGIAIESGWTMPPRGGVDRLSDTDVRLAVDYMLAAQAEIAARDRQ